METNYLTEIIEMIQQFKCQYDEGLITWAECISKMQYEIMKADYKVNPDNYITINNSLVEVL